MLFRRRGRVRGRLRWRWWLRRWRWGVCCPTTNHWCCPCRPQRRVQALQEILPEEGNSTLLAIKRQITHLLTGIMLRRVLCLPHLSQRGKDGMQGRNGSNSGDRGQMQFLSHWAACWYNISSHWWMVITVSPQISNKCIGCGIQFGKYYCNKCRVFDNQDKGQFHCEGCGICRFDMLISVCWSSKCESLSRVGGRENYKHCDRCCACYANSYFDQHKVIGYLDLVIVSMISWMLFSVCRESTWAQLHRVSWGMRLHYHFHTKLDWWLGY